MNQLNHESFVERAERLYLECYIVIAIICVGIPSLIAMGWMLATMPFRQNDPPHINL